MELNIIWNGTAQVFSFGVVGGGDAKLAASTALWFGWEHILEYIYVSSILGAVLTILVIYFRARGTIAVDDATRMKG